MPRTKGYYVTPEWRKPVCIGDFEDSCVNGALQEGCQWVEECRQIHKTKQKEQP